MSTEFVLLDVFPRHFNVNGDEGNVLTARRRLEWANFDVRVIEVHPGDQWPTTAPDLIHVGGGSVAAQRAGLPELVTHAARVNDWIDAGVPFVAVAGGFQLSVTTITFPGDTVAQDALGVFGGDSKATPARNSNFLIASSPKYGYVYGYENLGQAVGLADGQEPLGVVLTGTGNMFSPGFEGAVRGSSVGSQLHGPLLPKNPALADAVLRAALERRGLGPYVLGEKHERVDHYAEEGKEIIRERLKFTLPE